MGATCSQYSDGIRGSWFNGLATCVKRLPKLQRIEVIRCAASQHLCFRQHRLLLGCKGARSESKRADAYGNKTINRGILIADSSRIRIKCDECTQLTRASSLRFASFPNAIKTSYDAIFLRQLPCPLSYSRLSMSRSLTPLEFRCQQSKDVGGGVRVPFSIPSAVADPFHPHAIVAIQTSLGIVILFAVIPGNALRSRDTSSWSGAPISLPTCPLLRADPCRLNASFIPPCIPVPQQKARLDAVHHFRARCRALRSRAFIGPSLPRVLFPLQTHVV